LKGDLDSLRKYVEADMAVALVRRCPTCFRQFHKSDGCNKMTCPCGEKMCYICRAAVDNYAHFCTHFRPGMIVHRHNTVNSYTIHHPLIHHTLMHHPPSTIHHLPSTIHHPPTLIHHTPSTIHHPPSTILHPPYTIHHPPYTIHHTPSTIHSYTIHNPLYISRWSVHRVQEM
jgi:hypothetical protein